MKYLQKEPFSVPVSGPEVTQADWDAIFAPKCPLCGVPYDEKYHSKMEPNSARKQEMCGQCWHDDIQKWEDEQGMPPGHRFTSPGPNYKKRKKGKKS
jgi:hypothetical protein